MIEKEKLIEMVTAVQNGENDAATVLYETFYNDIYYYIKKTSLRMIGFGIMRESLCGKGYQ